jgi:hypothetical protein
LRFLGFFGLVFPAYVLIFMGRRFDALRDRRTMALFAAVIAISLPLYELGFLHHRPWLLVIPLVLLALVRLVTHNRSAMPKVEAERA